MKLKYIVTAFLVLGSFALEGPESLAQMQIAAPDLGVVQPNATVAIPVKVVNGAAEPVPTIVKGTAQVAGTVALTAGTAVGIAGTPNVNVVSMPQVSVAGTPNVNVVSMPAVQVAGTPGVNVLSMPQVTLAGTPTVNVGNFPPGGGSGGATTAVAFHQVVTIASGAIQSLSNVDVSAYGNVRVLATATGVADYQVVVTVVDENGALFVIDNNINQGGQGSGSALYTIPGRQIRILLIGPSFGSSTVSVTVYGRG